MTNGERAERLGFFGGSFDPVHHGHLIMARDAMEQLELAKVYFVPAARNPFKVDGTQASGDLRVEMLRAAVACAPGLDVLTWELERADEGPSYTIETALHLRERFPRAELYWIIGADQTADLERWHRVRELAELVRFCVVERPGYSSSIGLDFIRWESVRGHVFDVSATEIRERCQKGKPVDFFLPPSVISIIDAMRLYKE